MFVLVVASQKHDLLWVLKLESEEKADALKTVLTLVNVVSKEQVVEGMDISSIKRSLPDIEESHEVDVLSMDVSNNLDWWSNLLDDNWLSSKDLGALIGQFNDVLSLAWELNSWLDVLTFLWLQERLQEHLAERVIWVLIDLGMILLLWVQLLWLLSELVNRNLSNDKREIFSC